MTKPKVCIFTPTQRPGFDVTWWSVRRQKTDAEILWVICDELLGKRRQVIEQMTKPDRHLYKTHAFWIPKKDSNQRNLARAYNTAMDVARDWGANLFVSLQDYIYVPEDGIQKFVEMYETVQLDLNAPGIYTGVCSISADPEVDKVHDLNGMFSIFEQSYDQKPQVIDWMDVRFDPSRTAQYEIINPIGWETNWACIPDEALNDPNLYFDEEFDKAVAYENQDYAFRARENNYQVLIDHLNQVLSLPHKKYFAESWAHEEPLTNQNRELCEGRWKK